MIKHTKPKAIKTIWYGTQVDERAKVEIDAMIEVANPFAEFKVSTYKSVDDMDRGGFVLSIENDNENRGGLKPIVEIVEHGIHIHFGGQAEAKAVLIALLGVLNDLDLRQSSTIQK
jgi:hypothetical protein